MNQNDAVFDLIKTMTKAEKRNFKVDASKFKSKRSKSYMQLFDAIDEQKVYDEQSLRKKFKNDPWLKRFRYVKMYLHRQIMKNLKSLHDETTISLKLNGYLAEIEILYQKELFRNCLHVIKKAKAFAEKYELFAKLLEITDWESKVLARVDAGRYNVEAKIKAETGVLVKVNEALDLARLYTEIHPYFENKGTGRNEDERKRLGNILEHPLIKTKRHSFVAELRRLTIRVDCCLFARSVEEQLNACNHLIQHYESHPHQVELNMNLYLASLLEFLKMCLDNKKFILAGQLKNKARVFYTANHEKLSFRNHLAVLQTELWLLYEQSAFKNALQTAHEIDALIKNNPGKLQPAEAILLNQLYFNLYFRSKDYKKAQYYIQETINSNTGARIDLQSQARIINLILQYEQKEYSHLGYVLRSTYRYLLKRHALYEPEKLLLDFIKKAVKFTSEKELMTGFAELKQQIEPLLKQEPLIFDFPLIEWIDSKLQKRELVDILKENYQKAVAIEEALK